jgi:2-polyprenyl-3-methyl-5-hydroxy-6-metoxy-1,4-benzoquinol methylase
MYTKDYFTHATTKDPKAFVSYIRFLATLGVVLDHKTILDIGCATGAFLQNVYANNTCYGVDVSQYAIDVCRATFAKNPDHFQCLDLNYHKLPTHFTCNVLTVFDVLEHLVNYDNFSAAINDNLATGGIVLVTTPNAESILRYTSPRHFTGEIDPTHRTVFTPYTLDFFLRRLGLKKLALFTPYSFYFKMDFITKSILCGGQIVAIYEKNAR